MIYLYAGLGIAMLASIMAMFEMASGLTDQQMSSKPPDDLYFQSALQTNDRTFLKLVIEMAPGLDCSAIEGKIKEKELNYKKGFPTPSANPRIIGACDFNYAGHRVLIAPAPLGSSVSYRLFSCIPKDGVLCDFEKPRS